MTKRADVARSSILLALAAIVALTSAGCGGGQVAGDGGGTGTGAETDGDGTAGPRGGGDGAAAGAATLALPVQTDWVRSASFSPDTKAVVFVTADRAVWSIDGATGAVSSRGKVDGNGAVALIQGGRLAIDLDSPPRVFGIDEGMELLRMTNWPDARLAAFSPDGSQMLIAQGSELGRWDLSEQAKGGLAGEQIEDFMNRQLAVQTLGLPSAATALGIGPSGKFVVASDDKGLLRLWSPDDPTTLTTLGRTGHTVELIALNPRETHLVALDETGTVVVTTTQKSGFDAWANGLIATHATWTEGGLLVLNQSDGKTVAYQSDGTVAWSIAPVAPWSACWTRGGRLACTDGASLHLVNANSGEIVAMVGVAEGKSLVATRDGAHAGDAPREWLQGAGERSPEAVQAALGGW